MAASSSMYLCTNCFHTTFFYSFEGLLHSIPEKDTQVLEDLLQECVAETSAGGRMQAAEELKDLLGEYVSDDDNEANDDDENNDSIDVPNDEP